MQAQEFVSIHITENDGLPDKEFYDIVEDNKGLIWLAADKGFFRYDGKTFKNFTNIEQRGLSVFNLQEDHLNRVWCNNISGQFFYVENNKLKLFIDLNKELKGELVDFVVRKKHLWLIGLRKIYKIDLVTKKIIEVINSNDDYFGIPYILKDEVYFSSIQNVFKIDKQETISNIFPTGLSLNDKKGRKIITRRSHLIIDKAFVFLRQFVVNKHQFFKINFDTNKVNLLNSFKEIEKEQIYSHIILDNEVWFATDSGVWVYEKSDSIFRLSKRFLNTNKITKIIKDKDDNFWMTTLTEGIYVIPNKKVEKLNINFKQQNITCFETINNTTLAYGTINGEIGFYNVKTNQSKVINLPNNGRVSVIRFNPKTNTLFISSDLGGYTLNVKSFILKNFKHLVTAKSLTLLKDNQLLYTSNNNVRFYDGLKANVLKDTLFKVRERTYASFYNQKKHELFIATVSNLVKFDSLWIKKTIRYKNKPIFGKSITKTSNGIIWIATFKNGIYGFKNDSVVKHYTTKKGLTSNFIANIKAIDNKLWIALDNSIQLLDVNTSEIKTFTKRDGIVSYDVSGIEFLKERVYFSSNKGVFSLPQKPTIETGKLNLYFDKIEINEKDTLITSNYSLKYNQNAIKIKFNVNGFLYNHKNRYSYRLKGFNNNWLKTDVGINAVKYNSLPPGKYTFQVKPIVNEKPNNKEIKEIAFTIAKPFWKKWWFLLSIATCIFGGIILYYHIKLKKKEKERTIELEKIFLEKELLNFNLTALRSQMNPHFIFNALNSIQDLILKEDTDASYDYIVMFSELIRNTLSYSGLEFIPIDKELSFLKIYLQLEELRFDSDFSYTINSNIDEALEIPSLIIQPFIENALIHGLMHKVGKKKIDISFVFDNEILQCIITDNGIGRKKASEIVTRQGKHHESFALNAIRKRLDILKEQFNHQIGYKIEDTYKENSSNGTKVIVTLPFRKKFS